jgi:CPA1 family monovalent cation:H+ antiporter
VCAASPPLAGSARAARGSGRCERGSIAAAGDEAIDWFGIAGALLTVAALFNYLNHRFLRLPSTIGLMLIGLAASSLVLVLGRFLPELQTAAVELVGQVEFDKALMDGFLGFLLFAGALHVDLDDLAEQKGVIALLAAVGLLISTAVVGVGMWWVLGWLGLGMPFVYCLLFGALISPTDPIAVLSVLAKLGAPKTLETKIAGESLFNDGVGIVIFLAIAGAAGLGGGHGDHEGVAGVVRLFAIETLGGAAFGAVAGLATYGLMRSVEDRSVEILLSLALVAGGYALARGIGVSGPIAMVVAGLLIGNHGRRLAMGAEVRRYLDTFWTLADEILNAVLFVLIGLELLLIPFDGMRLVAGCAAIPIVLFGRWLAVSVPVLALRPLREFTPHAIKVLTWGGLRGGISVALALSLKSTLGNEDPAAYEVILDLTYAVVVFSIAVQGLTMKWVLQRLGLTGTTASAH